MEHPNHISNPTEFFFQKTHCYYYKYAWGTAELSNWTTKSILKSFSFALCGLLLPSYFSQMQMDVQRPLCWKMTPELLLAAALLWQSTLSKRNLQPFPGRGMGIGEGSVDPQGLFCFKFFMMVTPYHQPVMKGESYFHSKNLPCFINIFYLWQNQRPDAGFWTSFLMMELETCGGIANLAAQTPVLRQKNGPPVPPPHRVPTYPPGISARRLPWKFIWPVHVGGVVTGFVIIFPSRKRSLSCLVVVLCEQFQPNFFMYIGACVWNLKIDDLSTPPSETCQGRFFRQHNNQNDFLAIFFDGYRIAEEGVYEWGW